VLQTGVESGRQVAEVNMGTYPTGVRYRGINRAGAEFGEEWSKKWNLDPYKIVKLPAAGDPNTTVVNGNQMPWYAPYLVKNIVKL